jgi:alanine racemase
MSVPGALGEATPDPAGAGGLLTIDLGALVANWRLLAARAAPAECAAVVKADAYGIGLEPAVRALAGAGCRSFFVAQLSEAFRARAVAPDATIYVLNGLLPGTGPAYADAHLRPVLGSSPEAEEWSTLSRQRGGALAAAIHVDTGMNRLGLSPAEAETLAGSGRLADFAPTLLMSHFVAAEEPENPMNGRQIAAFEAVRALFPGIPASLANSSGIFLAATRFDLVRPGYALYGGNPTPGRPNPMRDVIRLEARILQTRTVEAGETAGYNAQWTAPERRRLATVAVGYADGVLRSSGATVAKIEAGVSGGEVIVGGIRCPIAGRISMDLLIVDVTTADQAQRGALVTLIGDGLTIDEVGRRAGTIGYEILTGLGRRFARRYVGEA